ncbi:MAG TPA: quinolinate synthase NadA [Oscillospiraceae bacterium]|nr:quinolinate synthase NadA [Oscillospiraceae bacterium]
MTVNEMQERIRKLKAGKGICVLAHSYQGREITEVADYSGDSYQLSVMAAKTNAKTVIMCGVRFMAETVKILSPDKTVYLANPTAGCPMAEQMDKELIEGVKNQFPDYAVVCYINTTAELKTVCDVCVTSSCAVKVCSRIPNKNILFIPDCNLGKFVADQLPEKNFKLLQGGCPVHAAITLRDVEAAKKAHPNALLLVHPECVPAVAAAADYVGSTSRIFHDAREFIIGTENSIAEHLQYDYPNKRFYTLSKNLICENMKATTLPDLLACLEGVGGEEITLDPDTLKKARRCIDEMIRLSE